LLKPPWTSITAYDLNLGIIKWSRPLGEEPQAILKGQKNTGVPSGSQRNGMIITSNGLVFSTVTNGNIYAYAAENGEMLWSGKTAIGIAGLPSMYEINDRVYIVVNSTTPLTTGWNTEKNKVIAATSEGQEGSYTVFALPKEKI
jgi:quinoprotein glucose dehydrogenase